MVAAAPVLSHRPRSIALLRALQLGDLLCAVPAVRAMRAEAPEAHITLVGLPWASTLVERFPRYFDDFLEFPGADGIPERAPDPERCRQFFAAAREQHFDLAVQLHGDGRASNRFIAQLGAQRVAGFCPADEEAPRDSFLPYPGEGPEVRRWLQLTEHLGAPSRGEHLEFPLQPEDLREATRLRAAYGLASGCFVCVHPGSRAEDRRWAPERFAAVGDGLASVGYQVALTGSDEERALTASVAGAMRTRPVDLAGRTSLGGLAALLHQSALLVSNDTGVAHLAAALDVPSVVVFTGSDPARWAPLDGALHRALGDGMPDGAESSVAVRAPSSDVTPEAVLCAGMEVLHG